MTKTLATIRPMLTGSTWLLCLVLAACGPEDDTTVSPSEQMAHAAPHAPTGESSAPASPAAPANPADPAAPASPTDTAASSPSPVTTSPTSAPITPSSPAVPATPAPMPSGLRWSDTSTWGGALPGAGAEVVVPAGRTIVLDTDTAPLGALRIEGTLVFADRKVNLTASSISVSGALKIGSTSAPFVSNATITLTGAPANINDGVSRGIIVNGGQLEMIGVSPSPVWTKLNDNAEAGATAMTLAQSVNWTAGSTIAVGPSDYYGVSDTQRLTLANAAAGASIRTTAALAGFRWGKMQYVTSTGMSLTPDASYTPPAAPAPTSLDERAPVANLSRNIVIQSVDDAAWRDNGFGAHLMIMDLRSKVVIDGVEFRRVGQAGTIGRYPIHWHLLSYSTSGAPLGDATGHVVRNSSIWGSSQRCIVLHGTNGVQVLNNICEDIKGHAYFLEDAVERRNVFDGNLALMIRAPKASQQLQVHEAEGFEGGPSGFWLTNPDNTVRNNQAGDALGNGFWMAFPAKPLGLSSAVSMAPLNLPMGLFENNTAHSNKKPGLMMKWVPIDAAGNVGSGTYIPTTNGEADVTTNRIRFQLKRVTSYKNTNGAYKNSTSFPDYVEWTVADNASASFAGAGYDGLIARALAIGQSLNNRSPYPTEWNTLDAFAFATYHSTFSMRDNTIVNFPLAPGKSVGAWGTSDYYLIPVEKGTVRNGNNKFVNSIPGLRVLPPNLDGQPLANRNWTLAGAIWDPNGYWGPANNFWVYDMPFFTAGGNCQKVQPVGRNGASCDGQYFGIMAFKTDFDSAPFNFLSPLQVVRSDTAGAEIGRWTVGDGTVSTLFGVMRHAALRQDGVYTLTFPDRPLPKRFSMTVTNAWRATDGFVFAVAFDGRTPVQGYTVAEWRDEPSWWDRSNAWMEGFVRRFTPASSKAEVMASSGDRIWQDTANNLVWIKFKGGLGYPDDGKLVKNTDEDLYRNYNVVLYPR